MKTSYLIIGGGIIGSTIAREILLRKLGDVTILEKEDHLGEHASGRNSGVIHSGINQFPGSIKAKMCVEGSRLLREYCRDHGVRMNECGTLVVAQNKNDERTLYALYGMGLAAGVEGLRIIDKNELARFEPNVTGARVLVSPTGAVVDSLGLLLAVSEEVKKLGGNYLMKHPVREIIGTRVITDGEEFSPDHIINCAGLYSDEIAHMMNVGLDYVIIPFRGEYMEVRGIAIHSMVYQTPDLRFPFLSVHLTKMTDGKVLAGPNAMLSFGRESYEKEFNRLEAKEMMKTGHFWKLFFSVEFLNLAFHNARTSLLASEFTKEIQKLCPNITEKDILPYRSGIRAQMVDRRGRMLDDIMVEFRENSTHVLNAVSPGMTSSLAFAKYVVNQIQNGKF